MDSVNSIEVRNVCKRFKIEMKDPDKKPNLFNHSPTVSKEKIVFDGLSLDVRKGDVLGIIGRNGSGKSTILSLLSRIMEPDSGTIEVDGKIAAILELGMGFHPDMSGRDNIKLKSELYGFERKDIEAYTEKIIEYSGIKDYIDNPVRTYSSGMKGRLAFSIMVNVDADIFLVDEVLSVGDTIFGLKAREHFKKLSKSGKTVVIVSHSLDSIEDMCNRVIWLEDGKIRMDGKPQNVCTTYRNTMNESPEVIIDLAMSGVAESQYQLAKLYKHGINFPEDREQYLHWIEQAAIQGHIRAQVEYGDELLDEGKQEEAIALYDSAAQRGDNEAKQKLASINRSNTESVERLIDLWRQISDSGDALSKFRYATLLLKVGRTDDDRKRAFKAFDDAASSGYPDAFYQLALMYRDGNGVAKSKDEMERCLVKGSEMGHVPSMTLLAILYEQGRLLTKDNEKSFEYYLMAAKMGDLNSMFKVSSMLRDGIGTGIDLDESDRWLENYSKTTLAWHRIWAADYVSSGLFNTIESKESLYEKSLPFMLPIVLDTCMLIKMMNNQDYSDELKYLETRARNNNIDALKRMGNHYYDGVCVDRDVDKAIECYEIAANLGDMWSKLHLGDIYSNGHLLRPDIEKSKYWYRKAAIQGNAVAAERLITLDLNNDDFVHQLESIAYSWNIDAIKRIANRYYDGFKTRPDYNKALVWYSKSAQLGDGYSKLRLAEMYRDGKGTPIDLEKSTYWFTK